ncbi:MAG: class I SAM-dependent methyltransferase, partial [Gemmatimonadota bacterium]|nr:class I SAM-dependent methyltransferase [Gemmatimonadota bacterium]
ALGAEVTAIDYSEAGLARTRELCGDTDRLVTRRVNLLDIPTDLTRERFDLVYSFGVLHHTGETWRALENITSLVADDGAMFLYLYGATSWSPEERAHIEHLRLELAEVPFDQKMRELQRRFPDDDPHQLFDLLGPVINDRVTFGDVRARVLELGFASVTETVGSLEVYARATRSGFPASALLAPVGESSEFSVEAAHRSAVRRGAAMEDSLRAALSTVPPRDVPEPVAAALRRVPRDSRVLDLSLPPDSIVSHAQGGLAIEGWHASSPAAPWQRMDCHARADVVVWIGASLGACRFPDDALRGAWALVEERGTLIAEIAVGALDARRTSLDLLRGYGKAVPEKMLRLLRAHRQWSTGDALASLGGSALLNPLPSERTRRTMATVGAEELSLTPCRRGTMLLVASRASRAS